MNAAPLALIKKATLRVRVRCGAAPAIAKAAGKSKTEARIMKVTRTDLKRKRCPMAVIKSTVARRTVIRDILISRLSRFCALVSHVCSLLIQTKKLLVLGVVILGHEDRARRRLRVVEWVRPYPCCECGAVLVPKTPLEELRGFFFAVQLRGEPTIKVSLS